jgi:glycosyltransferase involved in cell wall biosynthesis
VIYLKIEVSQRKSDFMVVPSLHNMGALSVKDLPEPPGGKRGWPWTVGTKPSLSCQADGSEWPRLSIVTPSYNQGEFLEETIRSVLLQGYPNLEYIIIDGGSSDESVAIIRKYERFLTCWVSEPDDGQTDAINKGLMRSTGAYLGWLNSDDLYTKGAFGKAIGALLNHPESVLVHSNRIIIDVNGGVSGCSPILEFNPPHFHCIVCSETAFWTREAMEKCGLLNSDYQFAMDLEFFSRLFLYGKFVKLDDYLGYFRFHASSKSSTIGHVAEAETRKIWRDLFDADWPGFMTYLNRLDRFYEFLKHPFLIGFPYFKTRILRGFG